MHVLEIDPDLYDGTVTPELATEVVPERETLTSISDRTDSLAAIDGNPRTLAGTTAEGNLLLVAVDGRQPGYSVGASFEESALIMQALCAVEAVNLDGGGSTAMTIGEELVNQPSDLPANDPLGTP